MNSGRKRVLVVGAGPAGVAAAHRLVKRGGDAVDPLLITRGGLARHLPGTIDVALGLHPFERYQALVEMPAGGVVAADVTRVEPDGVIADGRRIAADAVIAAPGLELDLGALPPLAGAVAAWDPVGAAKVSTALAGVPGGRIVVAVCGLPYRCPPAPFSLAIGLGDVHRRAGRFTRLCVTTPEQLPLAGVGGDAPAFLMDTILGAGIEMERGFTIDPQAAAAGELASSDGRQLDFELVFLVPPHRRARCLEQLAGHGPLVPVGDRGRVADGLLFVVGDAADTSLPRAAGFAQAQGMIAADAVLEALSVADSPPPPPLMASCFVAHRGGSLSRLTVTYPDGAPPAGAGRVAIDGPSPDLALAVESERRQFLRAAAAITKEL